MRDEDLVIVTVKRLVGFINLEGKKNNTKNKMSADHVKKPDEEEFDKEVKKCTAEGKIVSSAHLISVGHSSISTMVAIIVVDDLGLECFMVWPLQKNSTRICQTGRRIRRQSCFL